MSVTRNIFIIYLAKFILFFLSKSIVDSNYKLLPICGLIKNYGRTSGYMTLRDATINERKPSWPNFRYYFNTFWTNGGQRRKTWLTIAGLSAQN